MKGRIDLTQRELEVLSLTAEGSTAEQAGATLGISPRTASVHVQRAAFKLGAANGAEAVAVAAREGLIVPLKS